MRGTSREHPGNVSVGDHPGTIRGPSVDHPGNSAIHGPSGESSGDHPGNEAENNNLMHSNKTTRLRSHRETKFLGQETGRQHGHRATEPERHKAKICEGPITQGPRRVTYKNTNKSCLHGSRALPPILQTKGFVWQLSAGPMHQKIRATFPSEFHYQAGFTTKWAPPRSGFHDQVGSTCQGSSITK